MKLLTHNMLSSKGLKGVRNGFPLIIKATEVRVSEVDFNPDFVARIISKLDWRGVCQGAEDLNLGQDLVGIDSRLKENFSEDMEFLKRAHHLLLEVDVMSGELYCPETGSRIFNIVDGKARMVMDKEEEEAEDERERLERERDRREVERIERERAERERQEKERDKLAVERVQQDVVEREKLEREMERLERERDKKEIERVQKEKAERQRMEVEQLERQQLEREKLELEKIERMEREAAEFMAKATSQDLSRAAAVSPRRENKSAVCTEV